MKGNKLETPYLFPVINPREQQVPVEEIKKMGFNGIITNSYIISQNQKLRERALEEGIHKLLGFDGVVMTDSGSYQLSRYGKVAVSPEEIVKFQNDIGVDIGVILDIPTPPHVDYEKAESDLEETIRRARLSLEVKRDFLLAGTIQGSTHMELREKSAREMGKLDFDMHPIGGVVPMMENYNFPALVRVILYSKKHLPHDRPVHLFGCGHPMIFAMAVSLGIDLFDSAAYILYAKDDRYITVDGTWRLDDLGEFPCSCEVCSNHNPRQMQGMEKQKREYLLAKHNLHASLEEIRRVKNAIRKGALWELVEMRARNHPYLLEALKVIREYPYIEEFDPVTKKSAFFYLGPESLRRPEVLSHLRRLANLDNYGRILVLLPDTHKPYSRTYGTLSSEEIQLCIASPVFGVIPFEIEETYPLSQHEGVKTLDLEQTEFMKKVIGEYAQSFKSVFIHRDIANLFPLGQVFDALGEFEIKPDYLHKVRTMGAYQFGRGAGEKLFSGARVEISRTDRVRWIYSGDDLIATIRASDGQIVLAEEGGKRLVELEYPRNRVVVDNEVAQFAREGKSVFCKFVKNVDPLMKAHQETIVVDEDDNFLATGKAMLSAKEMLALEKGIAVKVRHKSELNDLE